MGFSSTSVSSVTLSGTISATASGTTTVTGSVSAAQPFPISLSDSPFIDAFGRLRTSEPYTLFDLTHVYDKQPLLIDEVLELGATSVHLPNEGVVLMTPGNTAGARVVRQTKRYIPYQPGKSLHVIESAVLHTETDTGIVAHVGFFDNHSDKSVDTGGNGVFLLYSGGQYYIVLRSYTGGTQSDNAIPQSSWNIDPFTGSGPSGATINFTKAQIIIMDLEWLGVGRVRVGFVVNGIIYYAHEFRHFNSLTTTYMTRAALPIRYEIKRVSGTGTCGMKMICSSVTSEGGFNPRGKTLQMSRRISGVTVNNIPLPIISIRLSGSAYTRAPVILQHFSLMTSTTANMHYGIFINATLTGATFAISASNGSAIRVDTAATAVNTGSAICIHAGYFASDHGFDTGLLQDDIAYIGANISGTSDVFTLVAQNTAAQNETVYGSLSWHEQF